MSESAYLWCRSSRSPDQMYRTNRKPNTAMARYMYFCSRILALPSSLGVSRFRAFESSIEGYRHARTTEGRNKTRKKEFALFASLGLFPFPGKLTEPLTHTQGAQASTPVNMTPFSSYWIWQISGHGTLKQGSMELFCAMALDERASMAKSRNFIYGFTDHYKQNSKQEALRQTQTQETISEPRVSA